MIVMHSFTRNSGSTETELDKLYVYKWPTSIIGPPTSSSARVLSIAYANMFSDSLRFQRGRDASWPAMESTVQGRQTWIRVSY
jgi:hypothetical protein